MVFGIGKSGKQVRITAKGSDLPATDSNGLSDPYFVLYHGEKKVFTSDVKSNNLNPTWEAEITPEDDWAELTVKVFDSDLTWEN